MMHKVDIRRVVPLRESPESRDYFFGITTGVREDQALSSLRRLKSGLKQVRLARDQFVCNSEVVVGAPGTWRRIVG